MAKAQEELESSTFEATAGGGAVKVILKGDYTMDSINIDPQIIEDGDVEMLQDLILTAINEAIEKVNAEKEESMGKATGGIRMPY